MSYYIARVIPQKKIEDKTFLYFADGTIGYVSSKECIKDFCVVCDSVNEYGEYQYVDNLENIEILEHSFYINNYAPIDAKNDFAIVLSYEPEMDGFATSSNGLFLRGFFYCKRDDDNYDEEEMRDNRMSDSDLAVIEELFFSQLVKSPYREITPELLTELLNKAEVNVRALNVNDIIGSFKIKGKISRDCKSGKDNDWTIDVASMESNIKYLDSYIRHILPPQHYWNYSRNDCLGTPLPSFFYRDDLDSLLEEKAENMRYKAISVYSKQEHIMYVFHELLTDLLMCNKKHEEMKDRVHNNYIKFWQTNCDDDMKFDNEAVKKWMMASGIVQFDITEVNIREKIYEHNRRIGTI